MKVHHDGGNASATAFVMTPPKCPVKVYFLYDAAEGPRRQMRQMIRSQFIWIPTPLDRFGLSVDSGSITIAFPKDTGDSA